MKQLCACEQEMIDKFVQSVVNTVHLQSKLARLCPIALVQAYTEAAAQISYKCNDAVGAPIGYTLQMAMDLCIDRHNETSKATEEALKKAGAKPDAE